MKIFFLEKTDSTNEYAKRLIKNTTIQLPFAVTAKFQTNGKGRQGNAWYSEYAKNVILSIACHYNYDNVTLNKFLAISTINTLKNIFPSLDFKIKWPNDIIIKNKKIAGILIEKIKSSYVGGIGINTNQTNFNGIPNASSIKNFIDTDVNNELIIRKFVQTIEYWHQKLSKSAIHLMFDNSLKGVGEEVKVEINDKVYKVKIKEVNYYGQLVVVSPNGKFFSLYPGKAKILYNSF